MSTATLPNVGDILGSKITHDVEKDPMEVWDRGVFMAELLKQDIALATDDDGKVNGDIAADSRLRQGTYKGTQLALTEMYSRIEEAAVSHLNIIGAESIIPTKRELELKRDIYTWSADGYPPHLSEVPPSQQEGAPGVGAIFNAQEKQDVGTIGTAFSFIIPASVEPNGTPYAGPTIADCERYNRDNPSANTDIMGGKNLGDEVDWYSDARFAQQYLSGVNPCTIERLPVAKANTYVAEARKQGLEEMEKLLSDEDDLFMQDYAYFREATGLKDDDIFQNIVPETTGSTLADQKPTGKSVLRYACAPVVIFQLHPDGRLHPLAITLDYRGSLDKSITIFNGRLTPDAPGRVAEKDDWPWRYAKSCAATADFARHEIAVHLVDTHMVEEAIIVATNRTIPEDHILFELLSPHWFRTMALNLGARSILVPLVIARISGFGPTVDPATSRVMKFLQWSYKTFNFQDKYIPNDLKKRGFNIEENIGGKHRNYPYATNMFLLWEVIRDFVKSVLQAEYACDADVQKDPYIPAWCTEIQVQGQIPTFPTITTRDQLIDAVTMCIHTASPQHTAVNYLQDYYYHFVPARPVALCTPLPKDLPTLQAYTEADLTAALPIGTDGPKWKDWLLAAQLPKLLSYKVEPKYNLITYAKSLYNVNKSRTDKERKASPRPKAIKAASASFYNRLRNLEVAFRVLSENQTEGTVEYTVLQPELTAVSILI